MFHAIRQNTTLIPRPKDSYIRFKRHNKGIWFSGMILSLGARGLEFDSQMPLQNKVNKYNKMTHLHSHEIVNDNPNNNINAFYVEVIHKLYLIFSHFGPIDDKKLRVL